MVKKALRWLFGREGTRERTVLWLLVAEVIVFGLVTPRFMSSENILTVLRNSVDLAVIAAGVTLVMVMGGIDVSVGSVLGVVAILTGRMIQHGYSPAAIVPLSVAVGAVLGYFNGVVVTFGGVPPIIATLGTMNIWRAVVFGLLGGEWITGLPPVLAFVNGRIGFIPASIVIIGVVYFVFWYITRYRRFGRSVYAIGNNAEASRLAGINGGRVMRGAYALLGALTGIAAMTYIGRLGGVEITVGSDISLLAIAAVIIGGTSVTGGAGSVLGTLLGVLFINVMENGVLLLGIPSMWEKAVIGLLLVGSVALDLLSRRRTARPLEV